MPGLLVHAGVAAICGHGGQLRLTPAQTRVLVDGQPVASVGATLAVLGCPGVNGVVCTTVAWTNTAPRVLVDGQPVLVQGPVPLVPPALANATVVGPPPNTLNVTGLPRLPGRVVAT
jgi:uncharacterized Zn-binding protein involved in type VI secretion